MGATGNITLAGAANDKFYRRIAWVSMNGWRYKPEYRAAFMWGQDIGEEYERWLDAEFSRNCDAIE